MLGVMLGDTLGFEDGIMLGNTLGTEDGISVGDDEGATVLASITPYVITPFHLGLF